MRAILILTVVVLSSFVGFIEASTYGDRCYCPQIEALLRVDDVLLKEMYRLRREGTINLPIYTPPVVPQPGVPPAHVLAILFPDLSEEDRRTMTNETYQGLKVELAAAVEARQANLAAQGARRRRKRETQDELTPEVARVKRALGDPDDFVSMLTPQNLVHGIHPVGGDLSQAKLCNCAPPTSRARKIITIHDEWKPDMTNLHSDNFIAFKKKMEEKIDALYGALSIDGKSNPLIQAGYGGTSVISVRLVQENNLDPPPEDNPNAVDLIEFEIDIPFAGRSSTDPAPYGHLDTIMFNAMSTLGFANSAGSYGGFCTGNMQAFSPPLYLTTQTTSGDRILSGMSFYYTCTNENKMIPFVSDIDSNFQFEIECERGVIVAPQWPEHCETEVVCTAVPSPPSSVSIPLQRVDDRTKFREGEHAYFKCSNEEAELNDDSGMNVYELKCGGSSGWQSSNWPECHVVDTCTNLPVPDASSKLRQTTKGNKVKIGDYVTYECIERDKFHEMDGHGAEISLFCGNPVSGGEGTLDKSLIQPSWPICEPLPCVCLGKDNGLNVTQAQNVLLTSCSSEDSTVLHKDSYGRGFFTPKRLNCGTFKPDNPTFASRCECPELGAPKLLWSVLEITTLQWSNDLMDANTADFKSKKTKIDNAVNKKFVEHDYMMSSGFLRAIVVSFSQGGSPPNYHVKAHVEYQFKSDANITMEDLKNEHINVIQSISQGQLSSEVIAVPGNQVSEVPLCQNSSLISLFIPDYSVIGAETFKKVGESVNVLCSDSSKLFTEDSWDMNDSDNVLTLICKPNQEFNVPLANDLPNCWAKCSGSKPVPPPEDALILDTSKTSETEPKWQGEEIWYVCQNEDDGLEIVGPSGELEGSQEKSISYTCDASGNYNIPKKDGELDFRGCLPRPLRCKCLGDFDTPDMSRKALDLFCRNDTSVIMPSTARNLETREYLPQIVPIKTRCGSVDPVDMTAETKCHCHTKEKKGAKEGIWMNIEILNMPYQPEFLDPTTEKAKDAKYIVEKALDEMYLSNEFMFNAGYVRTMVMRLEKGPTDLLLFRETRINAYNTEVAASGTGENATTIYEIGLPGDPIMDPFEISAEEIADLQEEAFLNDVPYEPPPESSTMVFVEVQFLKRGAMYENSLNDMTLQLIVNEWAHSMLWVNTRCFSDYVCSLRMVDRCDNAELDPIFNFDFTHNNVPGPDEEEVHVPVGSSVNLLCSYPNERITSDTLDDDPTDFAVTILCKPNRLFDLPQKGLPTCRAWCPGPKPAPPVDTGLNILPEDNNEREYWEGETVTYICNDTTLGIDASDSFTRSYPCVPDEPYGKFAVPREELNQTWPICMDRTTTVKPPIKIAIRSYLDESNSKLIEDKTRELYLSERNKGDKNMLLAVLVPFVMILLVVGLGLLCCTRVDNPVWRYFSRDYTSMY